MNRSRARSGFAALICAIFVVCGAARARADAPLSAEETAFLRDLTELTRGSHQQTGSEQGLAAERYVKDRLLGLGLRQVIEVGMPVWELHTIRCSLEIDGVSVPLSAVRPNLVIPPVTPEGGLDAPLLYAGRGEGADYGARSPEGKIVVLDYESGASWERAFALGARAVVFLGTGSEIERAPKHLDLPVNLLRLYAGPEVLGSLDLRRDYDHARLVSEVEWRPRVGRSVVARIAGTNPRFAGQRSEAEAIVLSARLDSYGIVPERSPEAPRAANVAALMEAAAHFVKAPAKRDVVLFFSDGDAFASQGTREIYGAWLMPAQTSGDLASEHDAENAQLERIAGSLAPSFWSGIERADAGSADQRVLWLTLSKEADFARDDAYQSLERMRLSRA